MVQVKLAYRRRDVLYYSRSYRKKKFPALIRAFKTNLFFLLPISILAYFFSDLLPVLKRIILLCSALIALVPPLMDFAVASALTSRKQNHFLGADLYFEEQGIRLCAETEEISCAYEDVLELLHNAGAGAYYAFIRLKSDDPKKQLLTLILCERCFVQGDPAAFGAFIFDKCGLKIEEIK